MSREPGIHDANARILAAVRALARGEVAAYGEVARRAGLPGRARLVARVLATAADPGLPWHRVVRADGRIAFPPGSEGFVEQSRRLASEGIEIAGGRVRGFAGASAPDLDAALWGPRR